MSVDRAKDMLAAALDVTVEQRSGWLREACGTDAALLAEVRSLLEHHDEAAEEFLRPPAAATPTPDPALSPGEPKRIGHYEVLSKVGEGGMGVVYEARQENPRRTVALKLLRPGYVSAELLRRFGHEAQVLGQLQHPGIAQIFEAGSSGGQPFFAMEFVRGRSLTDYAERNGLSTKAKLELFARVCDAVAFAHSKGVIHRDLKPGNILVDELGCPKILDFGVARATNSDTQTVTLRTDVGQLIGTLPYMSPEQVSGDPSQVDFRTDVYALGVTLYELLVRRPPLELAGCSIPQAASIIRESEPRRLSSLAPHLTGDVDTIGSKALDKDRTRRYASCAELAADIRRYLRDEPIRARPASALYKLHKFARRHTGLVAGIAAAFAAMLAGTAVAVWQMLRALDAESLAIRKQADAEASAREARESEAIASEISRFLRQDMLRAVRHDQFGHDARIADVLDHAAANVDLRFGNRPRIAYELHDVIANAYTSLGFHRRALHHELRIAELVREAHGGEHRHMTTALQRIAQTRFRLGDIRESAAIQRESTALTRRVMGKTPELGRRLEMLGMILAAMGDYAGAQAALDESLALRLELDGDEHEQTMRAYLALAGLATRRGDFAAAEAWLSQGAQIYEKNDAPEWWRIEPLEKRTLLRVAQNRPKEALEFADELLPLARVTYGWQHAALAEALLACGQARRIAGDLRGAEALLRESLEMRRTMFGSAGARTAAPLFELGLIAEATRGEAAAAKLIDEARELWCEHLGDDHPDTLLAQAELQRIRAAASAAGDNRRGRPRGWVRKSTRSRSAAPGSFPRRSAFSPRSRSFASPCATPVRSAGRSTISVSGSSSRSA